MDSTMLLVPGRRIFQGTPLWKSDLIQELIPVPLWDQSVIVLVVEELDFGTDPIGLAYVGNGTGWGSGPTKAENWSSFAM